MDDVWCVKAKEGVFVQQIDHQLVLFDIDSGEYFGLDEVGREIWEGMERYPKLDDLCDHPTQVYDAPFEEICGDLERFFEELAHRGLVVECEG